MKLSKKFIKEIIFKIPGSLYGNPPENDFIDGKTGSVIIDVTTMPETIRWFTKRGIKITKVWVHQIPEEIGIEFSIN